ncbi:MAG: helix-turn-helix domain-containing protein [Pseudonocardiaceae bacterium]
MDVDDKARTIGRRLRQIRKSRDKSLVVIAGLAGISKSQLDRIERGEVALDKLSEIVALADALQVAPSDLMRLPVPAPINGHTDSTIEAIRRALEAADQDLPEGLVLPIDVLADRVEQLYEMRRQCRLRQAGAGLPGLIRDLHTSIAAGRDLTRLLPLTAMAHVRLTHMWLRDAGAPADLRRQAVALARDAAREHGEVTTLAVAAYGTVEALIGSGMLDLARAKLDSVTLPAITRDTAGLVGELMMVHSLVAAFDRRPGDVAAPMETAAELAGRFGEAESTHDAFGFAFGPTDVGLYRMDLALEANEPGRALSIAKDVHPEEHPWATRQAAYWVHCGRALTQVRGRRDEAVMAFHRAETISPHHVHRNPLVRDVIATLLLSTRRDAIGKELRGMAHRAGLPT